MKPTDTELIDAIAKHFNVSFGAACDLIIEAAERMKVSP